MVKNKVVMITGSARGIGFEIGKHFAQEGAKVVLSDINEEGVQASAEELKKLGFEAIGIKADVTSEDRSSKFSKSNERYIRFSRHSY